MMPFMTLRPPFAVRPEPSAVRRLWRGAALLLAAGGAMASDCDLRLSNTEVNYGVLNRGEIDIRGNTTIDLGVRQLTMTAVCSQVTTMSMRFDGDVADPNSYLFGNKGRFIVKLSNATLDGNSVLLAQISDGVDVGTASASMQLRPNEGIAAISQGVRAVGRIFSAQVEVQAYIDEGTTRARDVTLLEGRGSLVLDAQ